MRIAQIAPLAEAVPPKFYGGTERIVSYLTEELVEMGHDVTLFASGDSVTKAKLAPMCPQALRLDHSVRDGFAPLMLMLEHVYNRAHEFDVLHFHLDYFPFSLFSRQPTPMVTTLHGRLDLPELGPVFDRFGHVPVVSISDNQREPLPQANYAQTIYHGLPSKLLTPPASGKPGYLAFLGRICPEKRVDRAIEIARLAGLPIKIAAKVDRVDQDYFDTQIKHLLTQPHVEFIGEINEAQKPEFLGNAIALLMPIDWPEPFGLVMIESMACGTPVIAWRNGSIPEVIDEGKSGYVVRDINEAVAAVHKLAALPREVVRAQFDLRFSARRMASDYVGLYEQMIARQRTPRLVLAAE